MGKGFEVRPAIIVLCFIALVGILNLAKAPSGITPQAAASGTQEQSDLALYLRIDAQVAAGRNYHEAALAQQRARSYPVRPFVAVRLPTLTWIYALVGPVGLLGGVVLAIAAGALLWNRALSDVPIWARCLMVALYAGTAAMGLDLRIVAFHEYWAGLLLSCALALTGRRAFLARLALAFVAVSIRELALPFLLLMGVQAVWRREWRELGLTLAALVVLIGYVLWHKAQVDALVTLQDPVSEGWKGMRGITGFARDMAFLLGVNRLPGPLAIFLALSPLAGWAAYGGRDRYFGFLWFAGFAVFCGLFARANNYYWAILLLPGYALGWFLLAVALLGKLKWARAGKVALP